MTNPEADYVVLVRPQVRQDGNGSWVAQYPEADWSVTGTSEADARAKIRDEFGRRLRNGESEPSSLSEDVLERHRAKPIPGIYVIDRNVYMSLREAPDAETAISRLMDEMDTRSDCG